MGKNLHNSSTEAVCILTCSYTHIKFLHHRPKNFISSLSVAVRPQKQCSSSKQVQPKQVQTDHSWTRCRCLHTLKLTCMSACLTVKALIGLETCIRIYLHTHILVQPTKFEAVCFMYSEMCINMYMYVYILYVACVCNSLHTVMNAKMCTCIYVCTRAYSHTCLLVHACMHACVREYLLAPYYPWRSFNSTNFFY